ncbi:MAG: LacI family DNA-binding transcriptional regulator [Mesorhizobium sp.]|nr:LacI family DNA-binding transcriptional regulator [Mesorhizobium sp.]
MNRPTVHDIAREAGVSLATVDRVLNARSGVRQKTIDKVNDTISRLGYVRDTSAANLARQRQYTFAFVLPEGPSQFAESIRAALREAYSSHIADRLVLKILSVPANDPHAIVRTLLAREMTQLDGLALMVPETPQVRDAVTRIKQAGIAVVTLVSDLPNSPRDYFVGTDSIAAGRTAGLLMGKLSKQQGEILVVTNSMRSRDSLERRLGFDAVMQADFGHLTVIPTIESFDDPERMEELVFGMLIRKPRLAGLYSMGSGNLSVLRALRRSARGGEVSVIMHELTPPTRAALMANEVDAVIAQNVGHLVRSAIRVLRSLSDRLPIFEPQERLRIEIVMRENLPDNS